MNQYLKKHGLNQTMSCFSGYKLSEVDGGDLSLYCEPNVVVDMINFNTVDT